MTKWNIGVSPSGKAADSDSVISRVQILPPQPKSKSTKQVKFAMHLVFCFSSIVLGCWFLSMWNWNMKKKKRIRKWNVQRTRFLISNQIDSVSLLELELVEKFNLNGSYFLSARSLCWSMFKAFAISFLSLVKVSEYFLKAQFSMKHDIETRKKRIRKLKLWTRFLTFNNQIGFI